jgi:hypothetical protein
MITRRREWWIRYVSAEAAFWQRLHISSPRLSEASRRFYAGSIFTSVLWVLFLGFFALALLNAALYFYWIHIFHGIQRI